MNAHSTTVAGGVPQGVPANKPKRGFEPYVDPERPIKPYDQWDDDRRAFPNELIRSSLFAISKRSEQEREIEAPEGMRIRYKGVPTDQAHLDVYVAVVHLARGREADATIRTTRHELLTTMHWNPTGENNYEWLWERLSDLTAGSLLVESHRRRVAHGPILRTVVMDDESGHIEITLNPDMRPLFDLATHLSPLQRRNLKSPLDKWLHAFLSSHAIVHPMRVETYARLTGTTSPLREFRRQLKASLDRLQNRGLISRWDIDRSDLVSVLRKPSKSQRKHLARPKKRP